MVKQVLNGFKNGELARQVPSLVVFLLLTGMYLGFGYRVSNEWIAAIDRCTDAITQSIDKQDVAVRELSRTVTVLMDRSGRMP